jgi:translation initiation factor 2B subunit (eIF-2B alpha/beta/delta family)
VSSDDPILEAFRSAAADRECGAAEIEAALLARLLELSSELSDAALRHGARLLAEGQPSMANLRSLAARAERAEAAGFASWARRRAAVLEELPERLAEAAWLEVERAEVLITISRSSAVAAVIEGAWERGWRGSVVVLDGSSAGRGGDQVQRLASSGEAVSQPDAAAWAHLEAGHPLVVVGADAVGDEIFANVCGTRALLELARRHHRRSLVVADVGKRVADRTVREMVEHAPLYRDGDREWPLFEIVPLVLVDGWIHD